MVLTDYRAIIKAIQYHEIPVLDDGHTYCIRINPNWKEGKSIYYLATNLKSEIFGIFSAVLRILYEPEFLQVGLMKTESLESSMHLVREAESMTDDEASFHLDCYFFGTNVDKSKVMVFSFLL